jgi:hypothetical protein
MRPLTEFAAVAATFQLNRSLRKKGAVKKRPTATPPIS